MSQKENRKVSRYEEQRKRVRIIGTRISIMVVIAIILIMSTYAWFTSQKDITISNLRGTVEVVENMEISLDGKLWYHHIDLSEMIDEKTTLQAAYDSRKAVSGNTAVNIEPKELLPASTVGGIGKTYLPLYQGTAKSKTTTSLKNIKECEAGKDEGFFAFDIYIKNTSRDGKDDVLQLNLNSAVSVLEEAIEKQIVENGVTTTRVYEGQAFSGIQNTVRVGVALYKDTVSSMAVQKEILEKTVGSTIEKVAIWEPNAPHHVQYVIDNNNKLKGSGAVKFEDGDAITTYALNSSSVAAPGTLDDVFNTDDSKLSKQVTLQTQMSNTTEGQEDYRILSADGKPYNIKDTSGEDFTIKSNAISRLRVYVWLEGQDMDCVNLASFGGGIEMDLGFTKDDAVGDVLSDKEPDKNATNSVN